MGDHFVLLVNRMFTDSRMDDDAVECRDSLEDVVPPFVIGGELGGDCSSHKIDFGGGFSPRELLECRICQDEDFDSNMEVPCSCRGSMKYAHRKCVQRWCNEKGDTLCEICHQEFKPGYTVSQALFQFGSIPMNFRGNWEISRRRFGDPSLIAMVSTDRNFHAPEDDYEHAVTASRRFPTCAVHASFGYKAQSSSHNQGIPVFGSVALVAAVKNCRDCFSNICHAESHPHGPAPPASAPSGYELFIGRRHCAAHHASSSRRYSCSLDVYPSYTYLSLFYDEQRRS